MTVGVMLIRIRLPNVHSLKGKRGAVKSVMERVRNRYNVAVAEVGDNDRWQSAQIGVSCVSNSGAHVNEVLDKVADFIEQERLDLEVLEREIEILHVL